MKVGLYSITYLGLWYRGEALTLEELIGRAKEYGYDGVEIDGKRPHGNPLDMSKSRCREILSFADGEGIEIYAVSANNDFSSPIPEHRECQLVYMREFIRMTADLGRKAHSSFPCLAGCDETSTGWPLYNLSAYLAGDAQGLFGRGNMGMVSGRAG